MPALRAGLGSGPNRGSLLPSGAVSVRCSPAGSPQSHPSRATARAAGSQPVEKSVESDADPPVRTSPGSTPSRTEREKATDLVDHTDPDLTHALRRNAAPSLAAVATVLITTLVLGVFIPVVRAVTGKTNEVRNKIELEVFINDDATRGEVNELTSMVYDAREHAIGLIRNEANAIGADDVVGIKTHIHDLGNLLEFMAIGTAVKKIANIAPQSAMLPPQAIIRDKDTWITAGQQMVTVKKD